jgi:hypothetical protein
MGELGRRVPLDWKHVEKYPLRQLATADQPVNVPVTIGVNWYTEFDKPARDVNGRWWVAKNGKLTGIRGGHCVCLKPGKRPDIESWWNFYDQGSEGACVGFGSSRMMSLLNRKRFDARWLWDRAKQVDPWSDTNPGDDEGTSVSAGMDVLRKSGHVPWRSAYAGRNHVQRAQEKPALTEGIARNRWATTVDEILKMLDTPLCDSLQAVPFLNSWGRSYPHITWMPLSVLGRLLSEYGEATMVTDR